ncbi:MAG TPA: SDR family oxidoreductase [Intrasporangium sp.]|uniref:SDR family oxidoreductase n=1 Tax=Intrasporangium sp. TaxID=1925024 RepID=UPI002D76E3F6|nr:SDR family oxidoreductase [Intrasporangium sp.]HET7399083.1 SDR family oxidoreductase [Intrasporangium sp.]
MSERTALVVGATGLTGRNAAEHLARSGWDVVGVSRSRGMDTDGVRSVSADISDPASIASVAADVKATHVFFCTWSRQDTEARNIEVNGAMLRNVLDATGTVGTLEHVCLVTGLKHYLGPFEAYAQNPAKPPFRESQPRLEHENFYYTQEDILWEAADRFGFSWSVHRPHTVIGYTLGNAMNMGVTLAVYGTLARETGQPFVFPGSPEQYDGTTDITDARLLAEHLAWAATAPEARNEAFNVTNGDTFHWRQMWEVVASGLGVDPAPYPGHPTPLEGRMGHAAETWRRIAEREGLVEPDVDRLVSWWHTDSDLGRTVETHADMTKSREAGFTRVQDSAQSFLDLFDRLRKERVIPTEGSPS